MINTSFELNNIRKDMDSYNGKITKSSPIVEIFSAMVNGQSLDRFGKKADKGVAYIKNLNERAMNGDYNAVTELNTLRRFVIETPVMEEVKLLNIFGTYQAYGYDETIEREVYQHSGERSRIQAANGDVVFPVITKERYPVSTYTVSGGYAVDYRRAALGDMSKENEGMNQVKTDIMNRCLLSIVERVYKALDNANGVKYMYEAAGLTKSGVDDVLTKIRRWGKPTVIADYAVLSQFTPWAGYVGTINSNTILGISDEIINELARNGMLSVYNGAILSEMPNPYNLYAPLVTDDNGQKNFQPMLPAGLGFIVPAGANSPIATYTRGGMTSMTGNDIATGKVMTRFDIEVGCDVARTQEYKIGVICDSNISDMG